MKKALIIGGGLVIAIIIAVLLLLGNINKIIKKGVETTGPMVLKAPVTLKGVKISFFSGFGELRGLTVGNPKGYETDYAFRMDRLKIKLNVKSVTSDRIHIKKIIVESPDIVYEGGIGKNNIKQLMDNAKAFTGNGSEEQEQTADTQGKKTPY